jgi:hypothetical protein
MTLSRAALLGSTFTLLLGASGLAGACSSSATTPAGTADGGDGGTASTDGGEAGSTGNFDGSKGDPNVLAGSFQARLIAPIGSPATPGQTSLIGKVYDGALPENIIWEQQQKDGDCRVVTPRVPFCKTPCGGSAVCVENDTCKPYPSAHSAGAVAVTGVKVQGGAASFSMSPVVNGYQPPAGTTLAYPGWAEGDEIKIQAAGEYYAPFTITTKGIAQLVLTSPSYALAKDQPFKLTWTPPAKAGASTVQVKLDISHHGGTKGKIECDTADSGSLDISGPLITKLLALGVAGFPTIIVVRRAVGSAVIAPGRVDLVASSDIEHEVIVPGVTSCTDTTQCPPGQTCQPDLTCK